MIDKLRLQRVSADRIEVFHRNGVHLGNFTADVDGDYVFWAKHSRHGAFSGWLLESLGSLLREINAGNAVTKGET